MAYFILFYSQTSDDKIRNLKWLVDNDNLEKVLRSVRQLLTVLVGQDKNLYKNFCKLDVNNIDSILPYYSGTFTSNIVEYNLNLSYLEKIAIIKHCLDGIEMNIGVVQSDEASYMRVVQIMKFLIELLEGNDGRNIQLIDKISTGNYNIPMSDITNIDFTSMFSMFYHALKRTYSITLIKPEQISFEIQIIKF